MDALREELEKKSEEEKAALYKELEDLKQQQAYKGTDTFVLPDTDDTEGYPTVTESEAYHRMQSIGVDIADRVVVGEERVDVLSFQQDSDDEVFSKNATSTPIDKDTHYVRNTDSDNHRTRSDSFVNIHSEVERASMPGLPDQSIVRLVQQMSILASIQWYIQCMCISVTVSPYPPCTCRG